MAVRFDPKRNRWCFDRYIGATKKITYYKSQQEAITEQALFDAAKTLGLSPPQDKKKGGISTAHTFATSRTANSLTTQIGRYRAIVSNTKAATTQRTERYYLSEFENFFRKIGVGYASHITLRDIELFRASELERKQSPASVNRKFATYAHFFEKLVEWGELVESPMARYKPLKAYSEERALWTDDEFNRICRVLPSWASDVLSLMKITGMRPIELAELTFDDVDFQNSIIFVKSRKASGSLRKRVIPISNETVDWLRTIKIRRIRMQTDDAHVFLNSKNGPFTTSGLNHAVLKAKKKLGLSHLVPYGLRHTFATSLGLHNVNQRTLSALLGHSTSRMSERYFHLNNDGLRSAISILDGVSEGRSDEKLKERQNK